jgi:hypothetical protein
MGIGISIDQGVSCKREPVDNDNSGDIKTI